MMFSLLLYYLNIQIRNHRSFLHNLILNTFIQRRLHKSCFHQTCQWTHANWSPRFNVGSYVSCIDVLVIIHIQLKFYYLHNGYLYSNPTKSQRKGAIDCWEKFCLSFSSHKCDLGAHHPGISGSTTVCLHPINFKFSCTANLCCLPTCHVLAPNKWTGSLLGFDGRTFCWVDKVHLISNNTAIENFFQLKYWLLFIEMMIYLL